MHVDEWTACPSGSDLFVNHGGLDGDVACDFDIRIFSIMMMMTYNEYDDDESEKDGDYDDDE